VTKEMMTSLGGERSSVQNTLIEYATGIGWEYISPADALRVRNVKTGFVFREIFINQMQTLNPEFMNQQLAEELIKRLERVPPNIEGNLVAWEYLKGLRTVFVPTENRERNVTFIDTENIGRNTFQVTDEFAFTNGSETIRPDIVFLINGVPVFLIETKAAHKIDGISEALDQIRRYHRECPELLAILQLYALTHLIRYYYSVTWNMSVKGLFNWKEETVGDFETLVKTFFDKHRVVKVLTDFILFTRQDDELKKVVLRPHQMRAVEDMPERMNTRENIFVLVDEAHRTTGGKLGNYLLGALPNATYIGFTGTPIDKTAYGKGTFITFGIDDPPHGYLDKYSIAESIADGTTVPLHYTLAPNELLVDKETLEKEFLDLVEAQGMSDVEELNKVLEKAVTLRNELKSPDRVEKIARYVADHYKETIEPMGYKAFLVAVDREACALYKAELDKHLPEEYSTVVYSPGYNDPPELAKYHLSTEEEKRIRKAFRKPDELPKILIVTEKLLTGFDAPILYCMYLDKPMRDHVLLQAIARVNRPYEDEDGRKKPSGFVLDFVGIFDKLEKALAFDSQDIAGVVNDIAVLKERFTVLIEHARESYISLIDRKTQDKAVEAVLQHFMDEEKRHEYYLFFKEIADIYDILSPDAFLRPYIADMETLTRMYKIVKEAYEPGIAIDKSFSRKTAKLVQAHTKTGLIKPALKIYEINEYTVKEIEESTAYDTEKVFNLIRSIEKTIKKDITQKPYLIPIGERAEQITMLFKERQRNSQETLEELKKVIAEINAAKREQAERDMPVEIFSIFWLFKNEGIDNPEDKANQMRRVLVQYPYWRTSERHEREIKRELYSVLFQAGITDTHMITALGQKTMNVLKGGSG